MRSFWCILEALWEDFWAILGSCWAQKSSWKLSESFVQAGRPFSSFDADRFWGFWRGFGKHFEDILLSLVDVNFIMHFNTIFRWFFIDFHALRASKNEQIAWEVSQKSKFRVVCYRMCLEIDFGWILGSGWNQFWVPSGRQKRLRKHMSRSMQMGRRRNRLTTPPPLSKIFSFGPQCERETGRSSQADVTPNGVGGLARSRSRTYPRCDGKRAQNG